VTVVRRGRRISTRQEAGVLADQVVVLAGPVVERVRRGRPVVVQGLRVVAVVVAGEVIDNTINFYFNFAGGKYNAYFRQISF
jgi:hypothetical protein